MSRIQERNLGKLLRPGLCQGCPKHEGTERPVCEPVKYKPKLCWRHQDVRDARVSPRERSVAVNNAQSSWVSEEHLASKNGDEDFRVCPAAFQSCFDSMFPHCAPFPAFWNGNLYSGLVNIGSM